MSFDHDRRVDRPPCGLNPFDDAPAHPESDAEAVYRRLLRWYPEMWRRERGEELLGVCLDAMEASGRHGPTWQERWDLRLQGLSTRIEWIFDPGTRPTRARVALLVQVLLGVVAVLSLVFGELLPRLPFPTDHFVPGDGVPRLGPGFGPVVWWLWVLPAAFALRGRAGAARLATAVAVVAPLPVLGVGAALQMARPPAFLIATVSVFGVLGLLADPPTSPAQRRVGLLLGTAGLLGAAAITASEGGISATYFIGQFYRGYGGFSIYTAAFGAVTALAVAVTALAGVVRRSIGRWSVPMAVTLVFWWLLSQAQGYTTPYGGDAATHRGLMVVETVVIVVAHLVASVLRRRAAAPVEPT